ncbi:SDR family oxidoreductase [Bradyrhizobium sp. SSUT77]|uniref:SDR family oxidoreductase n=1 Tax=Bradyrhizobium sp. SSUT77 TaxID=3040603 RepID=UPI00244BAF63|nr:SDR family oxidoreductase [Bradyrhizobium sp. SSUT77]MDH2347724.1 SDR family oxidoreductase [Bradyrhizobium sp. SSUT77]
MAKHPHTKINLISSLALRPDGVKQAKLRKATGWKLVPMPLIAKRCKKQLISKREKGNVTRKNGRIASKSGHFTTYHMMAHHSTTAVADATTHTAGRKPYPSMHKPSEGKRVMSQSPAGRCAAIQTGRLSYCRFSRRLSRFEGMRETIIAHFDANAEIAKLGSLAEATQQSFDVLNVNFRRSYFNVQKALRLMHNGSAIVFTSSLSDQAGIAATSTVLATKAVRRNFTRRLGVELIRRSVRVNAESSGVTEGPLFLRLSIAEVSVQEHGKALLEQISVKHFGKPRKIATVDFSRFRRRILHHRHRCGCRWRTQHAALSPTIPAGVLEPAPPDAIKIHYCRRTVLREVRARPQ